MSALLRLLLSFLGILARYTFFVVPASFNEVSSNFISKLCGLIEHVVKTSVATAIPAPITACGAPSWRGLAQRRLASEDRVLILRIAVVGGGDGGACTGCAC